ncbi:hypothetical protein LCGC14_1366960 [marine sediment metagenome]|uniref:Uncharacterized protein n=1 Tax=marine sediment metagenome TaxID=412755 RepID=A0A0F9MLL1_9ZZZZ
MADAVTLVKLDGYKELSAKKFRALFEILPFQFTYINASAPADASGTGATHEEEVTIALTGVAFGDFVFVSPKLDVADLSFVAYVTAADEITLQVRNLTGGDLTTFQTAGAEFNGFVLRVRASVLAQLV